MSTTLVAFGVVAVAADSLRFIEAICDLAFWVPARPPPNSVGGRIWAATVAAAGFIASVFGAGTGAEAGEDAEAVMLEEERGGDEGVRRRVGWSTDVDA